jgi:hypothetical protein
MIFFAIFTAPGGGVIETAGVCCKRHMLVVPLRQPDGAPGMAAETVRKDKYSGIL